MAKGPEAFDEFSEKDTSSLPEGAEVQTIIGAAMDAAEAGIHLDELYRWHDAVRNVLAGSEEGK